MRRPRRAQAARRALSLIELLVVVAIIALLVAILLPGLGRARAQALRVKCAANLRQLGAALHMYAGEWRGRALPLAYWQVSPVDPYVTYWWGKDTPAGVDPVQGLVWPYLPVDLDDASVLECPAQPRGLFAHQGVAGGPTSTYGYNGYFLSPAQTPGWAHSIGHRPWQSLDALRDPSRIFAFGDTMIVLAGKLKNTALLDPPMLFQGLYWKTNASPTTSFRHAAWANLVHAEGHVAARAARHAKITHAEHMIGSAHAENDPSYVPDWRDW